MTEKQTRFVIVGFDGLRPDCIDEDMPTLSAFIARSHRWSRYLATFPTETYVNHPSIFSGFRPNRHGIIANAFFNREMPSEKSVFIGSSVSSIETQDAVSNLIQVPTLGDRLARAGKTLRVICANSSGSTRLQHIHADRYIGHLNCCVHDLGLTLPAQEREALCAKWGNGVALKFPDFDGTKLVTDIFFDYELPRGLGDVTILWIGEPDHSSHEFGIFNDKTRQARKAADEAFKRVLDWWTAKGEKEGVQLAVMSDHGHGTVCAHYDLKSKLIEKGWKVISGKDLQNGLKPQDNDIVMIGDYTLGLWLTHPTENNLLRLRDELMSIEEVGMIFSQPKIGSSENDVEGRVKGTFSEALIFSDHTRGPDLRVTMRNNPLTGRLIMGASLEIGAGNHGGLLPVEINSLLAVQGNQFQAQEKVHIEPAGHDDFALTVMTLMGLLENESALSPMPSARLLTEAIGGREKVNCEEEILTLQEGKFMQYIQRVRFGNHVYVTEGARAGTCNIEALNQSE
ncbi:alkaline phosphatase family protein [Parasutterella secunda]|uniref:alkaline phosphatase family protein n=1 Tax=Parasutterella secunda TaxID=626947 RepID=UPI0025A4580F|nr:alkaline phosphatase family protein [Parasutterella secunda]MDM8112113.1 alkaline phosphatase family protein [Parasutterella secunda]